MVVFRCTRPLLERVAAPVGPTTARSTTALGDWYFKLLFTRPQWLLLGVSEKSRLPVVLSAREINTMATRFHIALERVLEGLGVPPAAIASERTAMNERAFAGTTDRRVIGSLNEFGHAVRWAIDDGFRGSLQSLSIRLAETPILPLHDSPDRMTRKLLDSRGIH